MIEYHIEAESEQVGQRVDQFLASTHPEISRTEIQGEIRAGHVLVSGKSIDKPSHRLRAGDSVQWEIPDKPILNPNAIPLNILYEDPFMVVLNKATGVVVHPGAGTTETTLVEGLLVDRKLPVSDDPARPGIVHRLDMETSGVIVVAKTLNAMETLKEQFADRSTRKHYVAVVDGVLEEIEGQVDAPIGRNPAMPQRMSIQSSGRHAITDFTVLSELEGQSLLWLRPRTGRTHQIRVHMRYIGHSIVGDAKYGGSKADRLMLHAWRLLIRHPMHGDTMEFVAPIPEGFPDFDYDRLD